MENTLYYGDNLDFPGFPVAFVSIAWTITRSVRKLFGLGIDWINTSSLGGEI